MWARAPVVHHCFLLTLHWPHESNHSDLRSLLYFRCYFDSRSSIYASYYAILVIFSHLKCAFFCPWWLDCFSLLTLCVCEYICCNFWRHSNTVPSPRHMPSAVLADEINVETRVGRMTGVRVCLKSTHLCISATNLFKVSVSVALSIMQLLAQSYSWVIALCAIKYATVSQSCLSVPSQFSHALSAPRIDSRRDADEIREYCSDSFAHEFFNRTLLMGGQTVVELEICWIVKACWGPGLPILLKKSLLLRSVLIYRHDFVGT